METELLREAAVVRLSSAGERRDVLGAARDATDAPVVEVGSTGAHALEPLLAVTVGGTTAFYADPSGSRAATAVAGLDDGEVRAGEADAVVEHGEGPPTLPIPDLPPLSVGARSVLGRCGWVRPTSPDDYRATGGFETLAADGADVLDAARGVEGRGFGDASSDEPVGGTWERVAGADADPAVVVNAHGSPGDRLLLESVPFLPLEGALAAARVVGADDVVVYLADADERARARVEDAIDRLPEPAADVRVAAGPDEYRAAEPTMALEAIEGKDRVEARLRPPGPSVQGLHGRPTLVHTPRTLAQVVLAAAGAEPTRLVTVRGDVRAGATIELSRGESLSAAREAVTLEGGFKAARVGGRFGGLTADLDVADAPDALHEAGLGTEGVVDVLSEDRCIVAHVGGTARFAREENCGRCVPCREGSTQLTDLLREVYDGEFRRGAIDELLRVIRSSSICAFGRDATRPAATALERFEDEFLAHANGRCPTGACGRDRPAEVRP